MSIAVVHEKLYQADHVDAVDASTYLAAVIEGIKAAAPAAITFTTEVSAIVLTLDQAIPLALIANELITNAIKYAYEDLQPGAIRIGLRVDGRLFQLLVSDDGKGLPVDFAPDKSRSLGMTIISSLARQLNADVSFVDNKPGGQCLISFARG